MGDEEFLLKWNDHHNSFFSVLQELVATEALTDVTIACGGQIFEAHKLMLCVCSSFFRSILLRPLPGKSGNAMQGRHPIVYLKDIAPKHLEQLLSYMYHGEINVLQDDLEPLIEAAKHLQVKGLSDTQSNSAPPPGPPANLVPPPPPKRNIVPPPANFPTAPLPNLHRPLPMPKLLPPPMKKGGRLNQLLTSGSAGGLAGASKRKADAPNQILPKKSNNGPSSFHHPPAESVESIEVKDDIVGQWEGDHSQHSGGSEYDNQSRDDEMEEAGINSILKSTLSGGVAAASAALGGGNGGNGGSAGGGDNTTSSGNTSPNHYMQMSDSGSIVGDDSEAGQAALLSAKLRYRCTECGKAFITPSKLQRHSYSHTGLRPFHCVVCGKSFSQSANLKTHIRNTHQELTEEQSAQLVKEGSAAAILAASAAANAAAGLPPPQEDELQQQE